MVMDVSSPRRRAGLRLRGYDYALPGAYFVTVCTRGRLARFGVVVDGEMQRSPEGGIVADSWADLPGHYPSVALDAFVTMPNHVHGIIVIQERVGAGFKPAPAPSDGRMSDEWSARCRSLSEIIRGFKTFSARRINELRGTRGAPVWQRSFHDHVIRDEEDLDRVRQYIESNPLRWLQDEENPGPRDP